ncbi:hypothetical protein BGZ97_004028 [Linnemannia gamsii]|uniref:Uncharacterized protein n=1 Tax=Linnemannia gamsii TaxID=64522 RepID=A0A9P6QWB4_9FUNG|nr:hypothetical protein BGZ97_004028 [Linnemannia gamsii]
MLTRTIAVLSMIVAAASAAAAGVGPGTDYPVLGAANRGQNLNYRGRTGDWIFGDLWGGHTGTWIFTAYVDC